MVENLTGSHGAGSTAAPPEPRAGDPPETIDPTPEPPREEPQRVDPTDDAVEEVNVAAIVWTVAIAASACVLANLVLAANYMHDSGRDEGRWNIPWQPPVAIALCVVSLVTFGGFYVAARRARIAIAASFLLTFLAMLPFALTIPELGGVEQTELLEALIDQFGSVVGTVAVFYFGSEAVISGLKLWTTAQHPEAAGVLRRADRDFPAKS